MKSNEQQYSTLWGVFTRALESTLKVLESLLINFVFVEQWGEKLTCRHVAMYHLLFNAWGVSFRTCGGKDCKDVISSDLSFHIKKNTLCYYCAFCGWKSCRVKQEDIAAMVFLMLFNLLLVFWHTYPPSLYLLNIFTRLTKEHIKWLLPVCQSSLKFGLLIRVDFMMITWIDWIVAVHKVLFLTLHFYKNIEYCEWSQHLCSCIEQLPIKHSSSLYVKTAASQRKSHPSFLSNT